MEMGVYTYDFIASFTVKIRPLWDGNYRDSIVLEILSYR